MACPNVNKQTGTRPKSRGSQNSSFSSLGVQGQAFMMGMVERPDNRQMVGQQDMISHVQEPNLSNLMQEHHTVSENLPLLREQLGREAVQPHRVNFVGGNMDGMRGHNNVTSHPRNQRQVDSEMVNTKRQMVSKMAVLEQRKLEMDRVLAGRGMSGREAFSCMSLIGSSA